jgi:hypothetical protein
MREQSGNGEADSADALPAFEHRIVANADCAELQHIFWRALYAQHRTIYWLGGPRPADARSSRRLLVQHCHVETVARNLFQQVAGQPGGRAAHQTGGLT